MKNPNDPIGNRTRDIPACRAVSQQTVLISSVTSFKQEDTFIKKTFSEANNWHLTCCICEVAADWHIVVSHAHFQ